MTVTLHLGDCLQILPTLPAQSVNAIITDLPYGTTVCKWDEIIPFAPMWEQVKRVLKPRGVFVTTASQPFTSKLVMSNLEWFKYEWVWRKSKATGHLDANRKPMKAHENVLVFCADGLPEYHPQGLEAGVYKNGRRANMDGKVYGQYQYKPISENGNYPKTIIEVANPSGAGHLHPTQKPVELYRYLILTYTNPGDTVLDFCAGSGTTGVACIQTGRDCILVEKEPQYFEIIQRRIAEAQQQPRLEGL